MANTDWRGILFPCPDKWVKNPEERIYIYRTICEKLGINEIVELPLIETASEFKKAKLVERIANSSNKKPLVIGPFHYLTAFVGKNQRETDHIFFDEHSDDCCDEGMPNYFNNGSFVNFMKGRCFFIGTGECFFHFKAEGNDLGKSILLRPHEIFTQQYKKNIFLSFDIDVFSERITKATMWHQGNYNGEMMFSEVKEISALICKGRNLTGINVAEYLPCYDSNNYPTADILINLLNPLINSE
ncbi:MAG: arginase family protein [Nanoarchaeota archaeon]